VLGGIGIQNNHAVFVRSKKGGFIVKPTSVAAVDQITVNGKKLISMEGVELKPNDRIIFGTGSVFVYKDATSSLDPTHPDTEE
jgi:hypothetical protein